MIQVLAIGELLADVISDEFVQTIGQAKSFKMYQGGSPANLCANLKWLGIEATLLSCVGNDSIGDFLISSLLKIGVSDENITRNQSYPTSIVMVARTNGTPDFIAYRMADIHIDEIRSDVIKNATIVHTTAFALSRNPAQTNILAALTTASRLGKEISIDWNYAPQLWGDDGFAVFAQVCDLNPFLKISMDDVNRFSGREVSIEDARDFLDQFQTRLTCLTCGKDGVWYKHLNQWQFMPAIMLDSVIDTTGAGDAFWSGFLSGYVNKHSVERCVQTGLEIAAKKIQKVGPLYLND